MRILTIFIFALIFGLGSCIRKEALNAEADIVEMILPEGSTKSEPKVTNVEVTAFLLPGKVDPTRLAPEFILTPGAIISPKSGTVRDFTTEQVYTVVSEDGKWKKEYTVRISQDDISTKYEFEYWRKDGKYENPYEIIPGGAGGPKVQDIWSSGNAGFSLVAGNSAKPEDFPTCSTTDAHTGTFAAKLTTRTTGGWGAMVGMPLAAGNLFIGTFDGNLATQKPLEATRFGLPFGQKPVRLKGYYRYICGGNVKDKPGNDLGYRDSGQIYAVFYETDAEVKYLNGDNVLTSPNIVAIALLNHIDDTPGTEYVSFDVSFDYSTTRLFDPAKLAAYRYNLAVVCTASVRGAYFEGAVGSTLYVDDIELICE